MQEFGANRHLPFRFWGRVPYANTQTANTISYAGTATPGQSFTALHWVWPAHFNAEAQLINWAGSGGLRWRVSTGAQMSLNNGVDAAQSSGAIVRARQWQCLGADYTPNRGIVWHRNGEDAGTAIMPGAQAWIAGSANGLMPAGWKAGPMLLCRLLTIDERKAWVYRGELPADVIAQLAFNHSEGFGASTAGIVAGAPSTASHSNVGWSNNTPSRPRIDVASASYGYSLLCDSNGNGSTAQAIYPNAVLPATRVEQLRAADIVTLGWRQLLMGRPSSAWRPLTVTHGATDSNTSGLSARMDPVTTPGQLFFTLNGRLNAGNGSTTVVTSVDVMSLLLWRWASMNVRIDYANNLVTLWINGARVPTTGGVTINASGAVAATRFHPQAVEGNENIAMGAYLASATAGLRSKFLLADPVIWCGGTEQDLRNWATRDIAPPGLVRRFPFAEGVGNRTADSVDAQFVNITREASLISTAWDGRRAA
jgi:hypothetical protein